VETKKKILCVDDDVAALATRKLLLNSAGYAVVTADSGRQALELLERGESVDAALLDYVMPGMNGEQLAHRLRADQPMLPLIAVSAIQDLPQTFLDLVDSQVQKGEDPEVLLATVAFVLNRSEPLPAKDGTMSKNTVLCVEDEEPQLRMRQLLFETAGYRVLQAHSAAEALNTFRGERVDLVVLDYWLSGRNGTVLAEEMKRLSPRTPIIMLSGFSALPGEDAAVDIWLRKASIEPEELIAEASRLINLRDQRKRLPREK
jgi:CheY-like chemotaxis protein